MATALDKFLTKPAPAKAAKPQAGTVHWLNKCIERGETETFSEVTTLTAGLAGELLRRNTDNRNLRATKLAQYSSDIRNGRWAFNGEPIIISRDGQLNDGQHRAQAVLETQIPIPVVFVFGVERSSRTTLDQGAARTAGDYLAMDGVADASILASLGRMLIAYRASDETGFIGTNYITNAEVVARVSGDEDCRAAAHFAQRVAKGAREFVSPSIIAFCYHTFAAIDEADAEEYLTQVAYGENLKRSDPAYTVRDRLLSLGRTARVDKVHVIFRGWNAYRQGRRLAIVKILGGSLPALV